MSPEPPPLFGVLFLPDFPLQAVLRNAPEWAGRVLVVIAEKTPKAPVLHCTTAARQAGIQPGMSISQARARSGEVVIKLRSPQAEHSADGVLLETAFGASAFVEKTGPGLCTLEFKGQRRPDLAQLARELRARLAVLDLESRLGFAPTADLALLAAQSATPWRIISGAGELSGLPIECLSPSPGLLQILRQWGIRTLGAFSALGKAALAERLGSEGLDLYARATGRLERTLRCLAPAESFEESIDLEQEIETLQPLLFILRRFLEQLACRLEAVYLVAVELRLRLGFAGGSEEYARAFKIPSPTREVEVLFRMLQTHLENFSAAQPIVRLHLRAVPSRPARQQFELFESALRDPNQFYETLARLTALLGEDRVGRPWMEPCHRPDAFRLLPADFTTAPGGNRENGENPGPHGAWAVGLALHRFRPSLPARVAWGEPGEPGKPGELGELGERRKMGKRGAGPVFLHCALFQGAILAAHGPLPSSGNWWNGQRWSRCEWDVQFQEGPLARIYEEAGAWFLEGFYD